MQDDQPSNTQTSAPLERRLGAEWDEALIARLARAVTAAGGTFSDAGRTLAGSQYVQTFAIRLPAGDLEARAETYEGLVLRGAAPLVLALIATLGDLPDRPDRH
ncbi:MAG: hypothetical protein AB7I01_05800 [Gammaproteobacteria bacterium]